MAGYNNFFKQLEFAGRESTGQVSLTEVSLLSPAQRGVQQDLYVTISMYCVQGRGEVVPNSISLVVSAGFTGSNGQRGSRRDHSQENRSDHEHRCQHFGACCDPRSGGGKEDEGGLCLAEQHKKKNCGICGKNLQS